MLGNIDALLALGSKKKDPGGSVTRPLAADDFPAIRARMDELERERAEIATAQRPVTGLRPHRGRSEPVLGHEPKCQPIIR
jgi:hypothetical protein